MEVYRIHDHRFEPLDVEGTARFGGRWNPKGLSILYASATFEGAWLEQLVRAGAGRIPRTHMAARIALPAGLDIPSLDEHANPDWHREPTSRRIGEEWVVSRVSLAMVVPSFAARPWGRNVLINPAHPEFASVVVSDATAVVWDPRLA